MKRQRSLAIDVARGVAVVLMIQTHAYDGFVAPGARASLAFGFTRFLAVFPLPTFLVLAGVGIAMRVRGAAAKQEPPARVRGELVRRGLEIVAAGYALNVALGVIDGADRLATYLRVDVLHAIGLSILLLGPLAVARTFADSRARLVATGVAVFATMAALSIPLTRFGRSIHGPLGYVAGLLVEVPGVTKMPFVPLAGFFGIGLVLGGSAIDERRTRHDHARVAAVAFVVAWLASVATDAAVSRIAGAFDRTHPAIALNLVELGARAVGLVTLVLAWDPPSSSRGARLLATIGRHSLLAYAFHLPFVYGRIPSPFARSLGMSAASVALGCVLALTLVAVLAKEGVDRRRLARSRLSTPAPTP